MPETRGEKLFFGVVMSITMAVGMEIYNVAISMGYALQPGGLSGMTNAVFPAALAEAAYMWIFVFIFSNLWGNRLGHALAGKIIRPGQDNPFFVTLMVSGCTVLVMCPTMSMAAALLFSVIPGRAPATELFRRELALDKSGYIIADESTRTSLPGVFAAGDVRTKALRQVVTAVSDGAVAVHYAEEYLAENR